MMQAYKPAPPPARLPFEAVTWANAVHARARAGLAHARPANGRVPLRQGQACACGSVRGAPDRGTVSASTPSSRDTSFSVSQHPVVTSCAAAPGLG